MLHKKTAEVENDHGVKSHIGAHLGCLRLTLLRE